MRCVKVFDTAILQYDGTVERRVRRIRTGTAQLRGREHLPERKTENGMRHHLYNPSDDVTASHRFVAQSANHDASSEYQPSEEEAARNASSR